VTLVKICGITQTVDAERACALGAWAIGLVLWPESPRACAVETAEQIGARFKRRLEVAGVFVNPTLDELSLYADRCSLSLLQLHGEEGPAFCREAARRTGCKVIKAQRVLDAHSVRALDAYSVDYHLLDAHIAGRRGGTGETFNWELVRHHSPRVPLILSGGLNADNVGDAIAAVSPFAVDTASGTEAAPGRKDPHALTAFFRAAASAKQIPAAAARR
jgi:phosphoribosylanthranilate isomerase